MLVEMNPEAAGADRNPIGCRSRVVVLNGGKGEGMPMVDERTDGPDQSDAKPDLRLLVRFILHDLEKPLVAEGRILDRLAQGHLDLSQKRHRDLVRSAAMANRRSRRMLADLNDVLSGRRLPFNPKPVDLCGLVQGIADGFTPLARAEGCELRWECAAEGPMRMDPDLVTRVLENFLYNALNHTSEGGRIAIRAGWDGPSHLVCMVDNDGDPIAEELLESIFDAGVQLRVRSERMWRGFGLGLAFCRMAAKAMGGKVSAEIRRHPDGMRFKLVIPPA